MSERTRIAIWFAVVAVAVLAPLCAQHEGADVKVEAPKAQPAQPAAPQQPPAPRFVQLRYPEDKEAVVAIVDGSPIWLEHLVAHIDERHYPGFARLMAGENGDGSADGRRILHSDLIAPWVRQFADIKALEAEARSRGPVDQEKLEAALSAALKKSFEEYLQAYTEDLAQRNLPTELNQKRINNLLNDFQMRFGLSCELQGWIDYLQPLEDWSNAKINDFFQSKPRYFGGGVTVQHILVQNRDPGTGILLQEKERIAAAARLSEIQKRIAPDGSNFADVARQFSDDTRSAKDGGKLENVERFDQRMPIALCRTAWSLKDGEISGVIESQYGWHIVRRIEHVQRMFMLFTDATVPIAKQMLQNELQEELLFDARKKRLVELKL